MEPLLERFKHIVIEGPIGAGKSSLAHKMGAHLNAELMLEQPQDNPFLERFYDDSAGYAFQTQLFFLFQRLRQVRELAQPGMFSQTIVSDFMFEKDALFARLNLSDEEYAHYSLMYAQLATQIPQPDLVIWLQASPQVLMQRIQKRKRSMEQRISLDYLERLCDAYVKFFQNYDGAPVFAVDTEWFNAADRKADLALLFRRLAQFDGRRDALQRKDVVELT